MRWSELTVTCVCALMPMFTARLDYHSPNAAHDPEHDEGDGDHGRDQEPVAGHAGHADEVPLQGHGDAWLGRRQRERAPRVAREGAWPLICMHAVSLLIDLAVDGGRGCGLYRAHND